MFGHSLYHTVDGAKEKCELENLEAVILPIPYCRQIKHTLEHKP